MNLESIKQSLINFIPPLKKIQDDKALRYQKFADLAAQASAAGKPVPDLDNTQAVQQFLGEEPQKLSAIDNFLLKIMPQNVVSPLPDNPNVEYIEPPPKLSQIDDSVRRTPVSKVLSPTATATPTEMPTRTPSPTKMMPTSTPPPHKQAEPYVDLINKAAKDNGVPQEILYRVLKKESGFNPNAQGPVLKDGDRASGIAQFKGSTAKGLGFDPMDPVQAIPKSAEYLASKFKRHGSWELALAAYNAGSGAVEKYGGIPPYKETENYVNSILNNE